MCLDDGDVVLNIHAPLAAQRYVVLFDILDKFLLPESIVLESLLVVKQEDELVVEPLLDLRFAPATFHHFRVARCEGDLQSFCKDGVVVAVDALGCFIHALKVIELMAHELLLLGALFIELLAGPSGETQLVKAARVDWRFGVLY